MKLNIQEKSSKDPEELPQVTDGHGQLIASSLEPELLKTSEGVPASKDTEESDCIPDEPSMEDPENDTEESVVEVQPKTEVGNRFRTSYPRAAKNNHKVVRSSVIRRALARKKARVAVPVTINRLVKSRKRNMQGAIMKIATAEGMVICHIAKAKTVS